MLAELVAFTLQCTLPSSTPITVVMNRKALTTCATVLSGPPPVSSRGPWSGHCHRDVCETTEPKVDRYPSWQAYCDAQSVRPCKYVDIEEVLRGWNTLRP